MLDGDSVKAFCRGLDNLCTKLARTLDPKARERCNELTETTKKDTLIAGVTNEFLPIITTQVQLTGDSVTYRELCEALIAHENSQKCACHCDLGCLYVGV